MSTSVIRAATAVATAIIAVLAIGLRGVPVQAHWAGAGSIVLRTVTVGTNPQGIAVDEKTSRIFITSDAGVSMLDAATGTVLHTVRVHGYLGAIYAAEPLGSVFVIDAGSQGGNSAATGSVSLLDARTGAIRRRTTVGKTPFALAIDVRTNRVFVTNQDSNSVSVLDATSGVLRRIVSVGQSPDAIAVDERTGHVFVGDQNDSDLYELDAQTGDVIRRLDMGDSPVAIAVVPSRAFVGFPLSDAVSVVDTRTGAVAGRISVSTPLNLVADEATHRLAAFGYLPGSTGTMSLIDTTSATIVRSITMARPTAVAFDDATARVFVADVSGTVIVLDARTGRIVQRAMAGALPQAIAVDIRTKRAFVVSTGMYTLNGPTGKGTVTMLNAMG